MRIRVLLFASYRDQAGRETVDLTLARDSTAADALARVRREVKGLEGLPLRVALAVNERHAPPDTPLEDGDVMALIPPVSGG